MKQPQLPTIPVSQIYKALVHTTAGRSLKTSIRYNPFRHEDESKGYWREILGPSAVTYSHMKHVYRLTKQALKNELKTSPKKFSKVEQEIVLLAALCHDFGEAILDEKSVGDIPAPNKKAGHNRIEKRVFKDVLRSLKINPKLKAKMWKSYYEVCHNKNSPLHRFFNLVEHMDYIDTGLRVHKNLVGGKNTLKRGIHLIGQILTYSVPILVESGKSYHSALHFTRANRVQIHEMFEYCIVEYRKAEKLNQVILGIDIAFVTWNNYIKS